MVEGDGRGEVRSRPDWRTCTRGRVGPATSPTGRGKGCHGAGGGLEAWDKGETTPAVVVDEEVAKTEVGAGGR